MPADLLTKALPRVKVQIFAAYLDLDQLTRYSYSFILRDAQAEGGVCFLIVHSAHF